MIKAVIFDVDGVLLDSFKANLKFYQDLMVYSGYPPVKEEDYPKFFHMPMLDVIKTLTKSQSEEEIKKIWQAGANRKVRYPAELLEMTKDADEIIKNLSKKYKLGIVTSRIRNGIYEVSHFEKLIPYFQAIVSYEDTKLHKPDPEPLLLVCKRLRVKPEESVYIGDAKTDILASKAAKMKMILYSKEKLEGADSYTSSFLKLPRLIENFN